MRRAARGAVIHVDFRDCSTDALRASLRNGLAAIGHRGATAQLVCHPCSGGCVKVNDLLLCLRAGLHGCFDGLVWCNACHVLCDRIHGAIAACTSAVRASGGIRLYIGLHLFIASTMISFVK